MTINVQMEDACKITINVDEVHVLVENLTNPNSCAINIHQFEDNKEGTIKDAYEKKDWERLFAC